MTIERCIGLPHLLEVLRHYSHLALRTENSPLNSNQSKDGGGTICDRSNPQDMEPRRAVSPVIH